MSTNTTGGIASRAIQNPANQSRARELTAAERTLADALVRIFQSGTHEFERVARELEAQHIAAPSGNPAPWTAEKLQRELRLVNESLDEAYRGSVPRNVELF